MSQGIVRRKDKEMSAAEVEALLRRVALAHFATVGADGRPHVVPFTFATVGDRILHAVDHKPKRTTDLRRLRNIRENPRVSILVDHYDDDDWSSLWWIRVSGPARVIDGGPEHGRAVGLLRAKYPQYRPHALTGPVLAVELRRWRTWSARA